MTRIIIEAIPPDKMRLEAYRSEGCGDWYWDQEGNLQIRVASTTDAVDDDEVFLIALHELVEAKLCLKHGITEGAVDAFDKAFEGDGEPGSAEGCPYSMEHRASSIVEYTVAMMLGLWDYGRLE